LGGQFLGVGQLEIGWIITVHIFVEPFEYFGNCFYMHDFRLLLQPIAERFNLLKEIRVADAARFA